MKLRDVFLTGMDIPNETRKLLSRFTVTDGMTESELKAYEMGVENTIRAMQALINIDQIVFHIEGNDCIEEFDLDDLIEVVEEKEGY
jgi:hypothetical protein